MFCSQAYNSQDVPISFERCPDTYLDFFLYDKGFSTHPDLSAESKRCILRNWQHIYDFRSSLSGVSKYLECITEESVTIVSIVNPKKRFIQTNSKAFGFPNSDSVASFGTSSDYLTYLYSPEYEVIDEMEITLGNQTAYTDLLTDYIFEILKYELPRSNSDHKLKVTLYTGITEIANKTI